jgi:hypothetical protein
VRWFINSRNVGRDWDEAISNGVPYGEVKSGSRQRPDGVQVSWRFTDPAKPVADGVVPFIIDWADTPHPSQTAANGATLISLRAEHPDPQYAKRLLRALALKLSVKRGNRPTLIATIGPCGIEVTSIANKRRIVVLNQPPSCLSRRMASWFFVSVARKGKNWNWEH